MIYLEDVKRAVSLSKKAMEVVREKMGHKNK